MKSLYNSLRNLFIIYLLLGNISESTAQYCTTNLYYYPCSYNIRLISFSTTGGNVNITNNNSGCANPSTGYNYYSTMTHATAPGTTVNFSITHGSYYATYKIFVDWNNDNDFVDAGENVYTGYWNPNQTQTGNFAVPSGTAVGVKRMRVRGQAYGYYAFTSCSREYYGETEDYNLDICTPISVTSQPVNRSLCVGGSTTFTVQPANATGYQWQVDNGSGFANISNSANYSGVSTSTLTVNATSAALNANKYRVNVTGCGTTPSNFATLSITDSTKINAQSLSGSYCDGINTELNVGIIGNPPSSIKWQVDRGTGFVDVPSTFPYIGFNNDTLLITPLADSMNGFVFRCVTTGTCNKDTADNITISVDRIPEFVTDPEDVFVLEGQDGSFKTSSVGKAAFRWQAKTPKNSTYVNLNENANYQGSLTSELTVKNPSLAQSGYEYRCILVGLGNCSSVKDTTDLAILNVKNTLSVTNIEKNNNITLYPNPSKGKDEVQIKIDNFNGTGNLNVSIADKLGRIVSRNEVAMSANTGMLNISKLAPGNYTITVENNNKTEAIKFVKE